MLLNRWWKKCRQLTRKKTITVLCGEVRGSAAIRGRCKMTQSVLRGELSVQVVCIVEIVSAGIFSRRVS